MHLPRNRTSWDKYMLKDISKYKFYGRSQLVRLRGKYTVQTAHCAVSQGHPELSTIFPVNPSISPNLPHWHLVWVWTNGKTCNLSFAITELKQHVLSLVQTTIGFGAPSRTGSSSPQTKPSYKRLRDSLGLC